MSAVKNHRSPAPAKVPRAVFPVTQAAQGAPPSRGRPSWSGLLRLSLVSVPVKAYPAVTDTATSPFHLLHAACGQRIRYAKNCPQHGPVESDAIVRGYEVGWRPRPGGGRTALLVSSKPLRHLATLRCHRAYATVAARDTLSTPGLLG